MRKEVLGKELYPKHKLGSGRNGKSSTLSSLGALDFAQFAIIEKTGLSLSFSYINGVILFS